MSFTAIAQATENSSFLAQLVSWNELDSQRTVTKRLDSLLREVFSQLHENGGETFDSPMEASGENEEKEAIPTQGQSNRVSTALVNTENAFEKIARIRGEYYEINSQYIRLFKFIEKREYLERTLMRKRISALLDQDPEKNQALRRIEEGISPRLKPMAATYMNSFHNEHITKTNSKMKGWDEEEDQLKQDQASTVEDRIRIIAKKCGVKFSAETALEFTKKQLALMSWREGMLDMELEKAYKQLNYEFGQGTGRFVSETIGEFEWVARIPIDDESDRAAVVSRMKQLVEIKKEVHTLPKGRLRQFFEVVDQCASLLLEHDRTHDWIQKRIHDMRLGQSNALAIPFITKPKAEGLEKYSEAEKEAFKNTQSRLLQHMQKQRLELIQIAARQDQIEKEIILSMIKDARGQFIECLLEWKAYDTRLQSRLSFFDSVFEILMPKPEPAHSQPRTSLQQSWYEAMPSGNEGWLKFFTSRYNDTLNLRSSIVLIVKNAN